MPGKVNPVMPEVINQIAFQVIGNDHTICLSVRSWTIRVKCNGTGT